MREAKSNKPTVVLITYPGLTGAATIQAFEQRDDIVVVGLVLSTTILKGKGHLISLYDLTRRTNLSWVTYGFLVTDVAWLVLHLFRLPRFVFSNKNKVHFAKDVNSEETRQWISERAPDYIASCYCNQILTHDTISIPNIASLNMHAAMLPALKGVHPGFRIMDNQLKLSGLTVHVMSEGIDEGDILYQEEIDTSSARDLCELDHLIWSKGSHVLANWIATADFHSTKRIQQQILKSDYYSWPTGEELAAFKKKGHKLISMRSLISGIKEVIRSK